MKEVNYMAEKSGFFDAHLVDGKYDRVYLAESFAKYFASFIGNGIFGGKSNELMVQQKATADMSIRVLSGQAWINGYWYENNDELSLSIENADGVLNRIDLIVLRWNNLERVIRLAVKKGTYASSPSAPIIQRDADIYELELAQVYVKAGATNITQANITDTRLNSDVCGLVVGVVKQLDTEDFGMQLNTYISEYAAEYKAYIEQLKLNGTNELNALIEELNAIIIDANNGLVDLTRKVNDIEAQYIESGDYPGCYYRMKNDEVEWLNPPKEHGIEYRTTERYKSKPVYVKTIYAASLPNNSTMAIDTNIPAHNIISLEGRILDTNENTYHPIPFTLPNKIIPTCVISSIEYDGELFVYSALDTSSCEGFFTLKYVKS